MQAFTMDLPKSQDQLLYLLKTRGPQSVKILAKQLDMTTMGVRQHLAELSQLRLVEQTDQEKQNRGRPVRLWKLTGTGHGCFPDTHSQVTLELIDVIRESLGEAQLVDLIDRRSRHSERVYQTAIDAAGDDLARRIEKLAALRTEEGYMAEVRLQPNAWLLIENHCPICTAARSCQQFCVSELSMFERLLAPLATIERVDHLLSGARRCAYRITPSQHP